ETAIAALAVARLGAIFIPLFSGYGAQAVGSRLADAEAKLLITADGFFRRGARLPMKSVAEEAAALAPSVERLLIVRRLSSPSPESSVQQGGESAERAGRDVYWDELVPQQAPTAPTESMS